MGYLKQANHSGAKKFQPHWFWHLFLRWILLDGRLVGDDIAHHAAVCDDAFAGDAVSHAGTHAIDDHGDGIGGGNGVQLCDPQFLSDLHLFFRGQGADRAVGEAAGSLHTAGSHGVDHDAVPFQFLGDLVGHGDDATFGGRIVGVAAEDRLGHVGHV